MKTLHTLAAVAALCILVPHSALAQRGGAQAPARVVLDASGRAVSEVGVRGAGGTGAMISIEYGQPHARGREVFGGLVPFDTVWRAGANRATQLTTDVSLNIGGTTLAPGSYSLALLPSRTAPRLVINSRTRQWGIPYNAAGEIARVPMRVTTLGAPVESFTIAIVPSAAAPQGQPAAPAGGVITLTWGTMQFAVDFTVQP